MSLLETAWKSKDRGHRTWCAMGLTDEGGSQWVRESYLEGWDIPVTGNVKKILIRSGCRSYQEEGTQEVKHVEHNPSKLSNFFLELGLQWTLLLQCCACAQLLSCVWLFANQWTELLSAWDFPGKSTGVGCCFLLQGIFLTQGLNPHLLCLLCWQADYLPLYPISILLFFIVTEPEFLLGPQSTQLNTITSTDFLNVRGDQVTQYWPIAWKLRLLDNTIWKFFFSW